MSKEKQKAEEGTINFPALTDEDKKYIEDIVSSVVKRESNHLYKRLSGLFHKEEDVYLKQIMSDVDDLKIFIKHLIKS